MGAVVVLAASAIIASTSVMAASGTWGLIGTSLGEQNFGDVAASETGQYLATAVDPGYVYTSDNYGATWTERADIGFDG